MNESPRAFARVYVCTAQDVVQCVKHPSSVCPSCVLFVSGALRWVPRGKAQRLPPLRGDIQRNATPDRFLADPLGARAEEVPDCSSYPLRIPWIATAVGCQSTLARLRLFLSPRSGDSTPVQVVRGTSIVAVRQPDSEQVRVTKLNQKGVPSGYSYLPFLKNRATHASGSYRD